MAAAILVTTRPRRGWDICLQNYPFARKNQAFVASRQQNVALRRQPRVPAVKRKPAEAGILPMRSRLT
jgi:hypothetical protein